MAIEARAPAKVNLALHVTGRRGDGYHLLDSLVVFAGVGDRLRVAAAARLSLTVTGPEGRGVSAGGDNLVLRAARLLDPGGGAAIALEKHLPAAAGIGGGSADAAAALRALAALWDRPLPPPEAVLALGADVPVCLHGRPARMGGIGERIEPFAALPEGLALVLVNPRMAVPTAAVFGALARPDNPPLAAPPARADRAAFAAWLAAQRNDLEAPARGLCPAIGDVLSALAATGPMVARMSGSGATCFGLYPDLAAATQARERIAAGAPGWWVAAAPVL